MADESSQPDSGTEESGPDEILSLLADIVDDEPHDDEEGEAEAADDGQAEADTDPDQPATQKFTVKVGGQEIEVDLPELIAGYQKDADYRQKTAAVGEERRAAEAEMKQAAAERLEAGKALYTAAAVINQELAQFEKVNWQALASQDPNQYVQLRAAYDAKLGQIAQIRQYGQQLGAVEQQYREAEKKQAVQAEQQALLAKLEDWKDPVVATREKKAIATYLRSNGIKDAEIESMNDHRTVLIARKAMLFDAMMANKPKAQERVAKAPARIERPGSGNQAPAKGDDALKRLSKSGSRDDAASAILALL